MDAPVYRASLFDDEEDDAIPRTVTPMPAEKFQLHNLGYSSPSFNGMNDRLRTNAARVNHSRRRTRSANNQEYFRENLQTMSAIKSRSSSSNASIESNNSRFDEDSWFGQTSFQSANHSKPIRRGSNNKSKSVFVQSQQLLQPRNSKMQDSGPPTPLEESIINSDSERVKVAVRCRPHFQDELPTKRSSKRNLPVEIQPADRSDETSNNSVRPEGARIVLKEDARRRNREFRYDYVFGPSASQKQVYDTFAQPIVSDVLAGVNGTILAYGQTGTGKTHTMGILQPVVELGNAGLIPRALDQVFNSLQDREVKLRQTMGIDHGTPTYCVSLTFLQIYSDQVQDLLGPAMGGGDANKSHNNLNIREDPDSGFYVEGLVECQVHSCDEALAVLNAGLENRTIASTLMNTTSSRSHTILSVNIQQYEVMNGSSLNSNGSEEALPPCIQSKLLLVDLAGSERVRRTTSTGKRLTEARSINGSLSALGNVISALAERKQHIRYRDSKLTKLLQGTLQGQSKAALIAAISPAEADVSETLSTLMFASRCMHVELSPVVHQPTNYGDLCAQLQLKLSTIEMKHKEEMRKLQESYEEQIQTYQEQIHKVQSTNSQLHHHGSFGPGVSGKALDFVKQLAVRVDETLLNTVQETKSLVDDWYKAKNDDETQHHDTRGVASVVQSTKSELQGIFQEEGWDQLLPPHTGSNDNSSAEVKLEINDEVSRLVGLHASEPARLKDVVNTKLSMGVREVDIYQQYVTEGVVYLGDLTSSLNRAFHKLKRLHMEQMLEDRSREDEVVNWSHILKYLLSANTRLRQQVRDVQKQKSLGAPQLATQQRVNKTSNSEMGDALLGDAADIVTTRPCTAPTCVAEPLKPAVQALLSSDSIQLNTGSKELSSKTWSKPEVESMESPHPNQSTTSRLRVQRKQTEPVVSYSPMRIQSQTWPQEIPNSSFRTDGMVDKVESKEDVVNESSVDVEHEQFSQLDLLLMKRNKM